MNVLINIVTFCLAISLPAELLAATTVGKRRQSKPWMRLQHPIAAMSANAAGTMLGISFAGEAGLWVLDLRKKKIAKIIRTPVNEGFFWSPDGNHLLFQTALPQLPKTRSTMIFDTTTAKLRDIGATTNQKNFFALEPIERAVWLWLPNDLKQLKMTIPDMGSAPWQRKLKHLPERYLAANDGIYLINSETQEINPLVLGVRTKILNAAVSPDGTSIGWQDSKNRIYVSEKFSKPNFLTFGRDPSWHRFEANLLLSIARRVGNRTSGFDLAMIDRQQKIRYLTRTDLLNESLPTMINNNEIIYTGTKTTDLYRLKLK